MNVIYAKAVLYAYPNIQAILDQIDELAEKKALSSMTDFSPAVEQCEKILDLTRQKDIIINLKLDVDKVLEKFSANDIRYFSYKYFHIDGDYSDLDFSSRNYYRKQIKLCKIFAEKLEKIGLTDSWFRKNCLTIEFFYELVKKVIEYENRCRNNVPIKNRKPNKNEKVDFDLYKKSA